MIPTPEFLKKYIHEAQNLMAKNPIQDVEFSGATYQIKIQDSSELKPCWAFIQLDGRGLLQDAFCSCKEEAQVEEGCIHLAAALMRIYQDPSMPLHLRFEHSLWNALGHLFMKYFGDQPSNLKKNKKEVSFGSRLKFSFSLAAAQKQFLDIFEKRPQETEETSLKFSNLSEEEIAAWRQGNPGSELKYELSCWADLAKWMLLEQDRGHFETANFSYDAKKQPSSIEIKFKTFNFYYQFAPGDLVYLIPSLRSIESPLKVFNKLQDFVNSAHYDEKRATLTFELKPFLLDATEAVSLEEWYYVPKLGFYHKEKHPLLLESTITADSIGEVLDNYAHELAPILTEPIYLHPVKANNYLSFDEHFNLHISAYILNPLDLSKPNARLFGHWAYLPGKGFFEINGLKYSEVTTIINEEDIADFIRREASWLNAHEGFKIHLQSLESQITYHLDKAGRLSFERRVSYESPKVRTKDFGTWIYIEGEGFYSKNLVPVTLPLQAGITIGPEQIAGFIHFNREELDLVSGFFAHTCPFAQAGLNIALTDMSAIEVLPFFQIKPEYLGKAIRFFDDVVYIEGEGFFELPTDMKLPEKFRERHLFEKEDELKQFFNEDLEKIRPFIFSIDSRLKPPAMLHTVAKSIVKKERNYVLRLIYQTEKGEIPFSQVYQAYFQKKAFLFSDAGLIDLESSRFDWFKSVNVNQIDRESNELFLTSMELIKLDALEEIQTFGESQRVLKDLLEFHHLEAFSLSGLKSTLRPYQEKGVLWLNSIYHFGLSCLLCDDMGLGKTHQAMGLFASIMNDKAAQKPLFLVVCPTSVLYHWQEKLEAFMPQIKILVFHGTKRRELFGQDYDLLLTSYGILRNEAELFDQLQFTVAVFDEIQVAKNHQSRLYASLVNVRSKMRLGMTGTPIENRLRELKSLFDIVLPNYMPPDGEYARHFVKPIEREHNMQQKQKLTRLIKPFILRRKKGDVLLDLPDKTEEIAHCDLHPEQAKLYQEVLQKGRDRLLADLYDSSKSIPYIHIFALLTHLKQVLDHPALYLKQTQDFRKFHSGKWDLFVELLQEARESEQKVVVFSQYLGMLDIIENYLRAHGIGYAGIRGATKDRSEQIKMFQTDPKCEVFAASLKAGGLGIDLTAASVVIHYDRWWNKAREDQATDRVHRIGQHQGVQVFKLVTKNTFEDRINELIERKGQLMEEVIGVDDHEVIKRFSREELMQLLQDYQ